MLLRDFNGFAPLTILEESKSSRTMRVRGIFSEADIKNGNGRIYPRTLLEREINKLSPVIAQRRLLGELDHPEGELVHLSNVSHLITSLSMDGNRVIGEAQLLDTPSGRILQELCKSGVRIGISSRSMGSVELDTQNEAYVVQDNLRVITFDMVADPSCQDAFPELMESNGNSEPKFQEIRRHEIDERIFLTAFRRLLK